MSNTFLLICSILGITAITIGVIVFIVKICTK